MNYGEEIILLYKEIDEEVNKLYSEKPKKVPCKKGCSDCCSQFFEISMAEYIVILNDILKWDKVKINELFTDAKKYMDKLKSEYPSLFNQVMSLEETSMKTETKRYFAKERFLFSAPCIFVGKEGNCLIYNSRPSVCRTTGTGYTSKIDVLRICPHIKGSLFLNRNRADLRKFLKRIMEIDILDPAKYKTHDSYQTITFRQRPIAYYIYDTFNNKKSRMFYENLCRVYFNQSKENIANEQFEHIIMNIR